MGINCEHIQSNKNEYEISCIVTGEWTRNDNEILFLTSQVKILSKIPPRVTYIPDMFFPYYYIYDVSNEGTNFNIGVCENITFVNKGHLNYNKESNTIIGEIEEQRVVKIGKFGK